ncbi:hypothetical protein NDU88_001626 [Pleurodeles waltl]|uniref:Uncharacterized protein n=1 Tax=Pleurodeles waltl TaxID=8319 RepID=A0AAV7P9B3_PLEWA|nr:hypothetical protein NDU88_001626 [Pleurodeles waltl]
MQFGPGRGLGHSGPHLWPDGAAATRKGVRFGPGVASTTHWCVYLPLCCHTVSVAVPLPAVTSDRGGGIEGSRQAGPGCHGLDARLLIHHGSKPQSCLLIPGRMHDATVSQEVHAASSLYPNGPGFAVVECPNRSAMRTPLFRLPVGFWTAAPNPPFSPRALRSAELKLQAAIFCRGQTTPHPSSFASIATDTMSLTFCCTLLLGNKDGGCSCTFRLTSWVTSFDILSFLPGALGA